MIAPQTKLKKHYSIQSDWLQIKNARCKQTKKSNPTIIKSKFISIYDVIFLQLSIPSIRNNMHFLDCESHQIDYQWEQLIKFKYHRDGFKLQNGRQMILSTLTNCSVWHCENSGSVTSILQIGDYEENRLNLAKHSQKHDIEITLLRIFGIPNPSTGKLHGVFIANVEDTSSLEKSIGRPSAVGKWRWLWSKFSSKEHVEEWDKFHVMFIHL